MLALGDCGNSEPGVFRGGAFLAAGLESWRYGHWARSGALSALQFQGSTGLYGGILAGNRDERVYGKYALEATKIGAARRVRTNWQSSWGYRKAVSHTRSCCLAGGNAMTDMQVAWMDIQTECYGLNQNTFRMGGLNKEQGEFTGSCQYARQKIIAEM